MGKMLHSVDGLSGSGLRKRQDLYSPEMLSDTWQPCSYHMAEDQWLCTTDHTDSTIKPIEPFNKTLWEFNKTVGTSFVDEIGLNFRNKERYQSRIRLSKGRAGPGSAHFFWP